MPPLRTARGRSQPLGAAAVAEGINFALLCRHGTAVSLVLSSPDGTEPLAEIALHPHHNRTGDHWHILVAGLPPTFSMHWCRHAHASHAMDRGAPVHVVQQTLGHVSLATTCRYVHCKPGTSSAQFIAAC